MLLSYDANKDALFSLVAPVELLAVMAFYFS
jgi:hypothetical protein